MKGTLNNRYDIEGLEIIRLARLALWAKFVPMGNFRGGPGARCLLVLMFLHYLGNAAYKVLARHGHHLQPLRYLAEKIRKK